MWFLSVAFALEVSQVSWKSDAYTVVRVDPSDSVELVGQADRDRATLAGALEGLPVAVAMNAGMYHDGFVPVGTHVEGGVPFASTERRPLEGNFGMLPNGVFSIGPQGASVVRTEAWGGEVARTAQVATQSGPMLVIEGQLHPAFHADSPSKRIRNGIGVVDGIQYWVISREPVRFHDLATLFRDHLGCDQALYLDGTVSELATEPTAGRTFGGVLVARLGDPGSGLGASLDPKRFEAPGVRARRPLR